MQRQATSQSRVDARKRSEMGWQSARHPTPGTTAPQPHRNATDDRHGPRPHVKRTGRQAEARKTTSTYRPNATASHPLARDIAHRAPTHLAYAGKVCRTRDQLSARRLRRRIQHDTVGYDEIHPIQAHSRARPVTRRYEGPTRCPAEVYLLPRVTAAPFLPLDRSHDSASLLRGPGVRHATEVSRCLVTSAGVKPVGPQLLGVEVAVRTYRGRCGRLQREPEDGDVEPVGARGVA